jgi:hypothetical protein
MDEETIAMFCDPDNWAQVYAECIDQMVYAWVGPPEVITKVLSKAP